MNSGRQEHLGSDTFGIAFAQHVKKAMKQSYDAVKSFLESQKDWKRRCGLVKAVCIHDGSCEWVHPSHAAQYAARGRCLLTAGAARAQRDAQAGRRVLRGAHPDSSPGVGQIFAHAARNLRADSLCDHL